MSGQVKPAVLAAALVVATACAWWLLPTSGVPDAGALKVAPTQAPAFSGSLPAAVALPSIAVVAGLSVADDPFLTPDLRQNIEDLLAEAIGNSDMGEPALLKKRLLALLPRHFPADLRTRAAALVERYVDYRVALGSLKPPADPGNARDMRAALEARQRVREQYFTGEESEALFGLDARLDSYTLARLEIEQNPQLTPVQKQAALKEAEQELSDSQRQQRLKAIEHLAVASQTTAFDAGGVSDVERHAQRSKQYGEAAASQLAQLDREERDWQSRLASYAAAQTSGGEPVQLQLLQDQLFSPQEQLRIEAALASRPSNTPVQR